MAKPASMSSGAGPSVGYPRATSRNVGLLSWVVGRYAWPPVRLPGTCLTRPGNDQVGHPGTGAGIGCSEKRVQGWCIDERGEGLLDRQPLLPPLGERRLQGGLGGMFAENRREQ